MSKKVLMPFADGFEEIEMVALVDTMRRGGVDVVTAGVDGKAPIGAHGISVVADCAIGEVSADGFDMIVLPGGYKNTMTLAENAAVQALIKEFDAKGKFVSAICAAPIALDRAGVLKDEYTCYPGVPDAIKSSKFVEKTVVESGNVLTSRGPGTAICFGLYIVEKLMDRETAEAVKEAMIAGYC
ncbi:MAG TPA: DJ-1/PfpI family protein [Campylobacterales bacterium]|nr:DJ-1/PfpI family protein [Campylobacterales bacterium]